MKNCIDCNKKIVGFKALRCRSCETKRRHRENIINLNHRGINNPAYKHGKYVSNFHKCIEKNCDNIVIKKGNHCKSCANKISSQLKWNNDIFKAKMSGENSSHWQGGISFEPYSKEFNENLKESIRRRDNYKCQNCNMTNEEHLIILDYDLVIHHIDYNKKNNKEDNLITLCNQCNARANYNRNYWKEYYIEKIFNIEKRPFQIARIILQKLK